MMTHPLTVQLTDAAFAALQLQAGATARTPEQAAAEALEQQFGHSALNAETNAENDSARGRFRRRFGTVQGSFGSADNEGIDADLAGELGDRHETD